jgi:hypothetical protein
MRLRLSVARWLIVAVLAAGAAGAALAIAGSTSPARLPLVLIYLAAVPGLAVASLLDGLDRLAKFAIAGISAILVNFGVAETMLVTGSWSIRAGIAAIAVISGVIAGIRLVTGGFWRTADSRR